MTNSWALLTFLLLTGCATTTENVLPHDSQLAARQIQTRQYDGHSKHAAMRSVVATLQDLGFTIDQADINVGAITATRLHRYKMRMTVTVTEKDESKVAVRVNARIGENSVRDAATYQDFFVTLDKAMFLTRNNIN